MKSLTKFVIFCIAVIIIYTVAVIVIQIKTGYSPSDTLTTGIFGFFGTELCAAAVLKIFKIKKGE